MTTSSTFPEPFRGAVYLPLTQSDNTMQTNNIYTDWQLQGTLRCKQKVFFYICRGTRYFLVSRVQSVSRRGGRRDAEVLLLLPSVASTSGAASEAPQAPEVPSALGAAPAP